MELTNLIRTSDDPTDDQISDDRPPRIHTLDHDRPLDHMDTDDIDASILSVPESVEEFVGFGKMKFEPGISKVSAYNQR